MSRALSISSWGNSRADQPEISELALEYSWDELNDATGSFSEARRLGGGAAGTVYKGTLQEGIDVAVKLIEEPVGGGFEDEVRLLSRCRHPNVVMLLGFGRDTAKPCDSRDASGSGQRKFRSGFGSGFGSGLDGALRGALVYELLPGGDAHVRLQSPNSKFDWRDRLKTALGVARGLAHLHKHRPEVFHRDIKTANILFGADGAARIADFGLACVSKRASSRQRAMEVAAGTPGYADPDYERTGVITEAAEVYSMGMVLVELLTGVPPAAMTPDGKTCIFPCKELLLHEDGAKSRILRRLDARAQWPLLAAAGLATLAVLCVHKDSSRRPSFIEVTALLQDLSKDAEAEAARASADFYPRVPSTFGSAISDDGNSRHYLSASVAAPHATGASAPYQNGMSQPPLANANVIEPFSALQQPVPRRRYSESHIGYSGVAPAPVIPGHMCAAQIPMRSPMHGYQSLHPLRQTSGDVEYSQVQYVSRDPSGSVEVPYGVLRGTEARYL